ncbi:MAG TPA: hypothetical protein VN616_04695 [Puia sp.]|nr:hypothetical protein [Puia sp.]
MARLRLFFLFWGVLAAGLSSQAQSIRHTTWKAYFLPINDSVTLRFSSDSMLVRTDSGVTLLQSGYKDSNNIVTLEDNGGVNACPHFAGRYQVKVRADTLIMILNDDRCDLRSGTLMAKWWVRVPEPAKPAEPARKKKRGKG